MDLCSLKRKQLQALCKKNGVPANKSNREMADLLVSALKVSQNLIPKDSGKADNESDSKDLPKKLKKVRFSPENEMHVYEPSTVRPKVSRRTMVIGASNESIQGIETEGQRIYREVSGNPTRNLRSRVRNAVQKDVDTVALPVIGKKRGRRSKRIESNKEENVDVDGNPPFIVEMGEVDQAVQDKVEINRGLARRRLRSREVIIEESVEGRREDFPLQRNNVKSGRLGKRKNGDDSQGSLSVNEDGKFDNVPIILGSVRKNSALEKRELVGMTTRSRAKLEEKSSFVNKQKHGKSVEGGREDFPLQRNNVKSGRLGKRKNGDDSQGSLSVNEHGKLEKVPIILRKSVRKNSAVEKRELVGMTTRSRAKLEEKSSSVNEEKRGKGVGRLKRVVAKAPLSKPISVAKSMGAEAATRSIRSARKVAEVSCTAASEAKSVGVKEGCKGQAELDESWKGNRNSRRCESVATQKAEAGNRGMEVKKETKKRTRNSDFKAVAEGESSVETREDTQKVALVLKQSRRSRHNTVRSSSMAPSDETGIGDDVERIKQLGQKVSGTDIYAIDQPLKTKRNASRHSIVPSSNEADVILMGNVRQARRICELALEKETSVVGGETFGEKSPRQSRRCDSRSDSVGACELSNTIEKQKRTPVRLPVTTEEPASTANISTCGGGPIEGAGLARPQAIEDQNYSSLNSMEDVFKSGNRTASKIKWIGKGKTSFVDVSSIDTDIKKATGVKTQSEEIWASASSKLQGALTDQEASQVGTEPPIVDAATNAVVDEVQQSAASGANDQSCRPSGIGADFSIGDLSAPEPLQFQAKIVDVPAPSSGLSSANNRTASNSKWSRKRKTNFMGVSSMDSDMKKVKHVRTHSEAILNSAYPTFRAALTDHEALEIGSEPLIADAATNAGVNEVQKSAADGLTPGGANDQSCRPSGICADFSIGNSPSPEQLEFQADVPSPSIGLSSATKLPFAGVAIEELSALKDDTVAVSKNPIECVGPSIKEYGFQDSERSQKGIKTEKTEHKVLRPNMRASPSAEASLQLDRITLSSHKRAVAQLYKEENIGLKESSHKLTKAEKSVHDLFNVEDLYLNALKVNDADRVDHCSAAVVASKSPGTSFSLPKFNNSHQQEYLLQDQHTLSVTSSVKRAGKEAQTPHSYDVDAASEELMTSNSHFKDRKEALEGINPYSLFYSSLKELVDEKREYPSMEKSQQHSRNLKVEEKENEKTFCDTDCDKASFSEATAPMRDEELVSEMLPDNGTMFSDREGSNDAVKGESPNSTGQKRLGSQESSTENVHVHDDITEGDSVHVNANTTEGGSDMCDLEMSTREGDFTTDEVEFTELCSNERESLTSDGSFQLDGHDLFSFGKAASRVTGAKADHQQEEDQAEDPHALSVTRTNSVERTVREVCESENLVTYPCDVDVAAEKIWTSNSKCEGELEDLRGIRAGSLPQTSAKEFQDIDQGISLMDNNSSDEVFCEQDPGDFAAEDKGKKVGFECDNVKLLLSESSSLSSPESHYNRKSFEENCSGDSVIGVPLSNTSQKIIAVGTVEESAECGEEFLPYMVSADGGLNKTTNRVEDKPVNLENSENINFLGELDDNSFSPVNNTMSIGVKAADMMESIGSIALDPMVTLHGSEANKFEAEVREVNTEGNRNENILYSAKRDENSPIAPQILRSGQKQAKTSSAGEVDTRACKAAYFLHSDLVSSNTPPTRSGSKNNSDVAEKAPSFSMLGNMVPSGCKASSSRLRKDADCPPLSPFISGSYYDNTPSEFRDETALFTEQELSLFQSNEEQGCKAAGGTYGSSTSKFSGHALQEEEKAVATTIFEGQVTEQQLTPNILNKPENISSPCVQEITDQEACTTSGITNILDGDKMRGTLEQSILEKASHDMAGTMPHPSCNEQEMNCSAKIILGVDNLCSKLDITLHSSTVARQNDSASDEEEQHSNDSNDTGGKEMTYDRGSSSSEVAQLFLGDSKIIAGEIGRAQESVGCLNDTKEVSRLESSKEDYQGFNNFLLDEHEDTANEAAVNSGYVGLHCLPRLDNKVLSIVQSNECSDNKWLNITSALDCNAVSSSNVSGVHASNHDDKALEPNLLFEDEEHYRDGKSDSEALINDLMSEDALEVQGNEMFIKQATIPVAEEQDVIKKHQMDEELSEKNCINAAVLDKPKSEEVEPLKMHDNMPVAVDYVRESFSCENLHELYADVEHSHRPHKILKEATESNDYRDSALSEFKVEYDPSNEKQESVANFSIEVAGRAVQLTREVSNQGSEEEPLGVTTLDVSHEIAPEDDQTSQPKMLSPQMTSSHAKRKENSLYAKQLGYSVMKSTKARTGAIQVTPRKTQRYDDTKENESNTKIEKPGIVTAPATMTKRRALWDISKN